MNKDSFKVQFADMISTFGNENFNAVTAVELWQELADLPEKEAVSVFVWAKEKFKKNNPPRVYELINKSKAIKLAEQKRIENLNLGPDPRLVTTSYDNICKNLGVSSLAEAIKKGKLFR